MLYNKYGYQDEPVLCFQRSLLNDLFFCFKQRSPPPPRLFRRVVHLLTGLVCLFALLTLMPDNAQAQTRTLSGTVTLEAVVNSVQPINFEFTSTTNASNFVRTVTLDASGHFTLTGLPADTYSLGVKGYKWLRTTTSLNLLNSDVTNLAVTLQGGDATNDNIIDVGDYALFYNAYDTVYDPADPLNGYDIRADFNCDGVIDLEDYSYFSRNGGDSGSIYALSLSFTTSSSSGASNGNVTLSWLPAASSDYCYLYRSNTPAHLGTPYKTSGDTPTLSGGYTDSAVPFGTYYYQVLTVVNGVPKLSNQVKVTLGSSSANPTIGISGNTCLITGYQPTLDSANRTPIYQATLTNGLLTSYIVYDGSGASGSEFFHQEPASNGTPYYPLRFADTDEIPFRNLFDTIDTSRFPTDSTTGTYHKLLSGGGPTANPFELSYKFEESYQNSNGVISMNVISTKVKYNATPTGLTVTFQQNVPITFERSHAAMSLAMRIGCGVDSSYNRLEHVLAAQPKKEEPKLTFRLPGSGVIHNLPLPAASGIEIGGVPDLRYYLDNGAALDVQNINTSDFELDNYNHQSLGYLHSGSGPSPFTRWGREYDRYAYGILTFNAVTSVNVTVSQTVNPPLPFHLVSGAGALSGVLANYTPPTGAGQGIFAKVGDTNADNNGLGFRVLFDARAAAALSRNSAGYVDLEYSITDFWDHAMVVRILPQTGPTFVGTVRVPTNIAANATAPGLHSINPSDPTNPISSYYYYDFNIPLPMSTLPIAFSSTGWFHLKAWIDQHDNQAAIPNIADEDDVEFGIYNYKNDAPNNTQNNPAAKPYLWSAGPTAPGFLQVLGLRAERIAADYLPLPPDSTNPGDPYHAFQSENATPNSESNPFLNPLQSPNHTQPDSAAITLIGSFTSRGINYSDVLSVVKTYVNPDMTSFQSPAGGTSYYYPNAFTAWAITNEPDISDPKSWVEQQLYPGWRGVNDGYKNSSGNTVGTPIVLGPNLLALEIPPFGPQFEYLYGNRLGWMQAMLDAKGSLIFKNPPLPDQTIPYTSGSQFLDGITFHGYTGPYQEYGRSWEEHGIPESIAYLQKLMAQYPDAKKADGTLKDLWITEHGWRWDTEREAPRDQARYIVRCYALAASFGIPQEHNYYYFTMVNGGYFSGDLGGGAVPNRGGMAYRILAEQTQGRTAYKLDTSGNNVNNLLPNARYVHAIAYTAPNNAKDPVIIVWGNDFIDHYQPNRPAFNGYNYTTDEDVTVNFTVPQNNVQVLDIMGCPVNYLQITANTDGTYTYNVPATASPVYVQMSNDSLTYLRTQTGAIGGWAATLAGETNRAAHNNGIASAYDLDSLLRKTAGDETTPFYQQQDPPTHWTEYSGGADVLNDGIWHYDDSKTGGYDHSGNAHTVHDIFTGQNIAYLPWVSRLNFFPKSNVTDATPVYVAGEVDFDSASNPIAHPIDNIVVVCSSNDAGIDGIPSINMKQSGVRDYDIQVLLPDGITWQTVKSVRGNTGEWVLHAHLDTAISAKAVRVIIRDVNNGSWYEDKASIPASNPNKSIPDYNTALRASLYEIEAYGP